MKAHTVGLLVFLVLIKSFLCQESNPFEIDRTELKKTVKEGSCVEMKCKVTGRVDTDKALWYWIKDAKWRDKTKDFIGTVVYSNDASNCSEDFQGRVENIPSSHTNWNCDGLRPCEELCSIRICELNKNDTGNYMFRYVRGETRWATKNNISLTVVDNPCPITFKELPTAQENERITLTCSTLASCKANLQIQHLKQPPLKSVDTGDKRNLPTKSIMKTYEVTWQDDGTAFSCQTQNNRDISLIRKVTLTVAYTPRDIVAKVSSAYVNEGGSVTLTCSGRGQPRPTFTWFKGNQEVSGAQWTITSIQESQSGTYTCRAKNKLAEQQSSVDVTVTYKPRNTGISPRNQKDYRVKVNDRLTMTCQTEAYPTPWYSWYRYRRTDRSTLIRVMSQEESLTLETVQRADEACYTCNASNSVGSGGVSEPLCIRVLFPPTSVVLSIQAEVTEGQLVTINCSAESFPPSHFTLTRSSKSAGREWPVLPPDDDQNFVRHTFAAASTDAADYTCLASNSEGRAQSNPRKLVVKYAPKEVKVEARHSHVVKENMQFRLDCTARSHPPVSSTTWTKVTHGESEPVHATGSIIFVKSARPSDSGFYSCEARNEIGAGESQPIEIKIHYGPKHTRIIEGEKHQVPDGTSFVPLSCFAHCYPPVRQYSWYKKADAESGDIKVSGDQNISVGSHEPGEYYCVAENDIGRISSDSVALFDSRVVKILTLTIFCLIFFIFFLVFFLYRHNRRKSIQQRPTNTRPCCAFLAQWKGSRRRNLMNEAALTGTSRSRDDLFPQQSHPDSTPATSTTCVYSTVNLPKGKPAPSAQRPARQNGALKGEDSLNYASLHFEKKQRKPEEEAVYAGVSKVKPKTHKKNQHGKVEDYENTHPSYSDTDTSEDDDEDEVEVTYSRVTFKPKFGQQRPGSDISTSEDNTQYSELKI